MKKRFEFYEEETALLLWLGFVAFLAAVGIAVALIWGAPDKDDPAPVISKTEAIVPPTPVPGPPVPQRQLPGYSIERWHKLQEASK